jgi:hypothetical protein
VYGAPISSRGILQFIFAAKESNVRVLRKYFDKRRRYILELSSMAYISQPDLGCGVIDSLYQGSDRRLLEVIYGYDNFSSFYECLRSYYFASFSRFTLFYWHNRQKLRAYSQAIRLLIVTLVELDSFAYIRRSIRTSDSRGHELVGTDTVSLRIAFFGYRGRSHMRYAPAFDMDFSCRYTFFQIPSQLVNMINIEAYSGAGKIVSHYRRV